MTEVKNNTMDLMNLQYSAKSNSRDKAVDDLGGFKTMLKDKSQKPEDGNVKEPDAKEDSESAVEAAAAIAVPDQPPQTVEAPEEAAVPELVVEAVVSGEELELVMPALENLENSQQGTQFQTLDEFRLRQLLGKQDQIQNQDALQDPEAAAKNGEEMSSLEILSQEELPGQTEIPVSMEKLPEDQTAVQTEELVQLGENPAEGSVISKEKLEGTAKIGQQNLVGEKQETAEETNAGQKSVKPPAADEDLVEMPDKQASLADSARTKPEVSIKEEKLPEESAASLQEKALEPDSTPIQHVKTEKPTVYTTVKAESQEQLEANLSDQLLKQIQTGKKELDVQLEPENLGKIQIKVSYEDNQVSVSVLCTESKTLRMLTQSAGDLGTILESNIERPVQIVVDKQEADYLNNQEQQEGRQQQQEERQDNHREESSGDFLQKLRLGILDTEGSDYSYIDYR